ncbi:MAG: DNA gyrase inhibitor YacG [Planctomycetota bacterium]
MTARDRPTPSTSKCPTCCGQVPDRAEHRPFCSVRCKMVDLGRWFRGDYAVPGEDAVSMDGFAESVGGDDARDR